MMSSIIIASLLVSLLSLVGLVFLFVSKKTWQAHTPVLISFAAGALLATALLELLPEALELADPHTVLVWVLVGVAGFFGLERLLVWHHCHTHQEHEHSSTWLIFIGDGLHNFLDGVAIASAFLINPAAGWTTTLAIAAHEVPQELADTSVLLHNQLSLKKAIGINLISALLSLVGAVFGVIAINSSVHIQPYILGLTAGMFMYIALSDLIPELHHRHQSLSAWHQLISFIVGIALVGLVNSFFAHS